MASNHISNFDPFLLGLTSIRFYGFMAKEDLFKNKLMSFFFYQVGAFPVKRDTVDFYAVREALRRLKSGQPLIMFPEGTRGVSGRVKKINPGIGLLVQKSKVPVLPAYIKGSDKALPHNAKWFKRYPVTIVIGEPITFRDDMTHTEIALAIMDKVQSLADVV